MANQYVINWTDNTDKTPFIILPGEHNTDTSLNLYGMGAIAYGEGINESLVHLLENFSSPVPPSDPTKGQIWFNSSSLSLHYYNGANWTSIGGVSVGGSQPPADSNLWYDTSVNELKVFNGTAFELVCKDYVRKTGSTVTGDILFTSEVAITSVDLGSSVKNKIYIDTDTNLRPAVSNTNDAGLISKNAILNLIDSTNQQQLSDYFIVGGGAANSSDASYEEYFSIQAGTGNVSIEQGTLNLNSHRIINVLSPSANNDATNKGYVDTVESDIITYVDQVGTSLQSAISSLQTTLQNDIDANEIASDLSDSNLQTQITDLETDVATNLNTHVNDSDPHPNAASTTDTPNLLAKRTVDGDIEASEFIATTGVTAAAPSNSDLVVIQDITTGKYHHYDQTNVSNWLGLSSVDNANTLGPLQLEHTDFLRSNISNDLTIELIQTDTDGIRRQAGLYGTYDGSKISHIWGNDVSGKIELNGSDFGSLTGAAYKFETNTTGGVMASDHQLVWCQSGTPTVSLGTDIWTSGNVIAFSDARLKTDIQPIENALSKVNQIGGYTYERTDINVPRQAGVLAQEVLSVLPEAVVTGENEEDIMSVAHGNLIGLLIGAINELTTKVETLETQIHTMKK